MGKHNYFTKWWFHLNSYNVICLGMYDFLGKKIIDRIYFMLHYTYILSNIPNREKTYLVYEMVISSQFV